MTTKPSVLDFTDLSECANKVRHLGYWAPNGYGPDGRLLREYVHDASSRECKYDRKHVDPACAAANCKRIGGEK